MKVNVVGGGPAGLYLAILLRQRRPRSEIVVQERNRPNDTFGFGVVFSDATLENLHEADAESARAITRAFHHWDDIDIHFKGEVLSSTGHGFAGLSRRRLLEILGARCEALGVDLRYETEVEDLDALRDADLLVGADGVNSHVRERWADAFEPHTDWRENRFVWLGTTRPFDAFTFYFKESAAGLWRGHVYQYEGPEAALAPDAPRSTFIVEARPETLERAGLDPDDEASTRAYCQSLFAEELGHHALVSNRSVWRRFPTISNARWSTGNVVLLGDAAHTAHFSIGSGTKLALEDAIALVDALDDDRHASLEATLEAYEAERRPPVESLQRAAQASLEWFEETERFLDTEPIQFGFNLLTRSLRITHEDLRVRDPAYVDEIDRWFARDAQGQSGVYFLEKQKGVSARTPPPPLFTPFKLRQLVLPNRIVVSAMCQYSAHDGTPNDWHLVHLGSRAIGGAGLVMAEMTDISPEARISPGCTGLYTPEHLHAWKRIVQFVHRNSEAKIGIQLGHAGRKGATRLSWEGDSEPLDEGAWPIVAPSPLPFFPHSQVPQEMTREDMDRTKADYVHAAEIARKAGFDLIEVHVAHGYLLASFVSPLTNQRTDAYGGSLENRMRYPLEVIGAVREVWPDEKPLSVRISAVDWYPGGLEAQDAVDVAHLLAAHDVDVVDVSAGQTVPDQKPRYGRLWQTPFADRIRHEVDIATMAVGAISSYTDVNTILAAGRADLCAIARMHLWDPYWTRHAAYALGHPLPWPDQYSSLERYTPRFE